MSFVIRHHLVIRVQVFLRRLRGNVCEIDVWLEIEEGLDHGLSGPIRRVAEALGVGQDDDGRFGLGEEVDAVQVAGHLTAVVEGQAWTGVFAEEVLRSRTGGAIGG